MGKNDAGSVSVKNAALFPKISRAVKGRNEINR